MKLSHLTLAILAGISLAACGGSGNDDHVNAGHDGHQTKPGDTDKPKPGDADKPKPGEQTPGKDQEVIDPTNDQVVSLFELDKSPSQGTSQYLRNEGSRFDRDNNPDKTASATAVLGVNLNSQNPEFTNFVAARTKFTDKDGRTVTVAQFLGSPKTGVAGLTDNVSPSLQMENVKNVKVPQGENLDTILSDFDANIKKYSDQIAEKEKAKKTAETAGETAKVKVLETEITELTTKIDNEKKGKTYAKEVLEEYSGKRFFVLTKDNNADDSGKAQIHWGDEVSTETSAKGVQNLGLVGMNFIDQDSTGQNVATTNAVQGLEKNLRKEYPDDDSVSIGTTRIFGRYYLASDDPDRKTANKDIVTNSYRKAVAVPVDKNGDEYVYGIAVEPMELNDVQYGRVTGIVDPVSGSFVKSEDYTAGGIVEKHEEFAARNNKKAVNYYFYRGTNATTLDQMKALPSDQVIQYQGHALMYGIDNSFHGNGKNLPNAFGDSSSLAVGNFVQANYDVAKAAVSGEVYNAWQFDRSKDKLTKDTLVTFTGSVTGNTVLGSAKLAYKPAPEADFRAAFFGKDANEMGGSFNSTTFKQKYGPAKDTPKWGGVFGAERVNAPKGSNSWLGDVGENLRK